MKQDLFLKIVMSSFRETQSNLDKAMDELNVIRDSLMRINEAWREINKPIQP